MSASRFTYALAHALRGLRRVWLDEPNLRVEVPIGVAALLLTWWLRAPAVPIVLSIGLVLGLEILNSAVEAMVDLSSPRPHELAGAAKDMAAAAVLMGSLTALVVGLVVLGPPLLHKLGVAP